MKTKSTSHIFYFIVLFALFFAVTLVANSFLRGVSVDLTEDQRFSISDGSETIIQSLDKPIELHFFFSENATKGLPSLRNYAAQVEALLKKYDTLGGDNIRLNIINPEPFSVEEDKASDFGLTAAKVGPAQDSVYFGLAGTNRAGDTMLIGFFDPNVSALLEYDISRLIYQLSHPEPIKLTIVSDILMSGQENTLNGERAPPFVAYQEFETLFDVQLISNSAEGLPDEVGVLLIAHPQGMNIDLLYDIDQHLMRGGKAIVLVDPHFESDTMTMMGSIGANSSAFPLLGAYSISVDMQQVVLDSQLGLEVSASASQTERHYGFLRLPKEMINRNDVATGDLDLINGASFGNIALSENASAALEVLLQTSNNAAFITSDEYASAASPNVLLDGFNSTGAAKVLSARITGSAPSYFTQLEQRENDGFLAKTDALNIVVIADVDMLTDRFWVQSTRFFDETISTPFASNGDLLINLIENYGGAQSLIGLRGRGDFARPFTKVAEIRASAEAKFREKETQLTMQLQETEEKLRQLQEEPRDAVSSIAKQQAIDEFMAERIKTRYIDFTCLEKSKSSFKSITKF